MTFLTIFFEHHEDCFVFFQNGFYIVIKLPQKKTKYPLTRLLAILILRKENKVCTESAWGLQFWSGCLN